MNPIQNKISALRTAMQKLNLDAWYISGTDPHSSEYLPKRWQTREFISGFTGSYGIVALTQNEAALWTDSRYFIQAEEQLKGSGISLQKLRVPNSVSPEDWLNQNLQEGSRVGIDAQTISLSGFRKLQVKLVEKNIELVEVPDLLDVIWEGRPLNSNDLIFELGLKYCGVSRKEKRERVIAELEIKKADLHVFTMLDEVAWLYNLRGSDINFNPVFNAFALMGINENYLFVENRKVPVELKRKLEIDGVQLKEYSEFYSFLNSIENKTVYIDVSTTNFSVYSSIKKKNKIIEGTSVVSLQKARKNSVEIKGFKEAMKKDGVALIEFLFWLKTSVGSEEVTEFTIGEKLKEFRANQSNFKGESFPPIVGYKEHGAIVHLSVDEKNALPVIADGILLFDSGGQYLDGTTDVTRTVALGKISVQQKRDYTLVLKGMIGLSLAKFPYGTKGCHLDILARKPLWENGMNYGHGTGHGVGHFLNVHEGPIAIRQEFNENSIEPGMVISNEPAFYREGEYGIRTENMIVCIESNKTEYGQFLAFETLTLCPIDTTLIELELMNTEEIKWLNNYHKKVNSELKPLLDKRLHDFLDILTQNL